MRHHTAVELPDGGWHFASVGRAGGHPIGACADHDPHPTEADARRCYQDWRRGRVGRQGEANWTGCFVQGCREPAKVMWGIEGDGYSLAVLCEVHDDEEHAIRALGLHHELAGDRYTSG